ncbi:dna methylase : Eco57I restriction endonuclease OS=Singulisphaera acidiphila (strain ATCC BAA-1392 / DSM 18658 / VKM B-2454 / MOB10) GN=Sinac_1958 PE=4 SV=1: Methyltransf_26 [Gemmataceae bacterium]|nr:dna methylase : Eco57I restriction endonuclease OS=Singulisphaera acidiphila (strain ATCC BAA-1392 / DSM 18658 / VKM B-2454 / MOB10) GN=Sinac_1958 PE=4 SV=1: Methyltransf_26 [Gemmataceae bacterium]VTU01486.1 dna methylase : Eco57I restriction endonuclease OS=Singulisphaera acidiphila (strain ATCC BAA-1392 / DSM 18658 / VKM B-2454 / MOB10) GN=Sinac_1958 PE=4 SV=1: Methyltransf_26 [Gemmataceae bacterium]
MIDTKALVPQLQKQVELLTEDLLVQARTVAAVTTFLREHFDKAVESGRLSQSFEEWSEDYLEQVAVSWVLSCVFVRFLEDNHLIDECWIAGEGDRGKLADGHYEIYFRSYPHDSDREYLKYAFREVGKIPAAKELFDDEKTPLWAVDPSGDAARRLLLFFKEIDAERGGLKRQFDTRETQVIADIAEKLAPQAQFLGDLYQDLSEHARKKYALLQTPEFVQQFILDRTLMPAIDEFGLKGLRLIDPTCGSGHFLLSAFDRLFALWMKPENGVNNPVVAAQNALDSLFGVDINPFAIAITRFRLLVAAVRACGINRLHQQSYAWKLNLAVGDSLLRGSRPMFGDVRTRILLQKEIEFEPVQKLRTEDPKAANDILDQGFHVVVGNPPYITVKDQAQNQSYREVYSTCHRQYSLGVPFTQRFWDLAIRKGESIKANAEAVSPSAGFIGMITANSFMKREFGKKLVEEFFPKVDFTHVLDTSKAFIPDHGTPTVILFGRARRPVGETVRAVLGIQGEPTTPKDPANGLVWQSIITQLDRAGVQDDYTSTADVLRETFAKHPWSIGGGGAVDLKTLIDEVSSDTLCTFIREIGFGALTRDDDVYLMPLAAAKRRSISDLYIQEHITGENVRDWASSGQGVALWPYNRDSLEPQISQDLERCLWPYRRQLCDRVAYGLSQIERGLQWYEFSMFFKQRYRTTFQISFAAGATHNHFVLKRGHNLFNRHAPVILLAADAKEDDHLALLGVLNSSTACFWMKQNFQTKGSSGIGRGIYDEKWETFYEYTGTGLERFPIPSNKPLELARKLDRHAVGLSACRADEVLCRWKAHEPLPEQLEIAQHVDEHLRLDMIAMQEELDWECYRHYGLLPDDLCYPGDDLPELKLGERAFEIVMARKMAQGQLKTAWFARHGSTPITELPAHWPEGYRKLVERRIQVIATNKEIALIEKPEYKRRWNTEPWDEQQKRALENWLLDRLETPKYRKGTKDQPELTTTAQMADVASADAEFLQVAGLYRGRPDFDVAALVAELVEAESVPVLPILRYKPAGLRKREVWERTWDLQRQQDAGEDVGDIPVPPKYGSTDFMKPDYWRLRGKLDVPKERWVSYPHCSTDSDPTLVVGWAGWNHLEQATALIAYYDTRKREGWDAKRLTPLLAGLDQLLPWIHQWHTEIDAEFGETAGQSFQAMLAHDAHELGLTLEAVRTWTPPEKTRKARTPGKKKAPAGEQDDA